MTDARRTFDAVAEAVLPGPPHHPTPGAVDAGAGQKLVDVLTIMDPGAVDGAVMLLDGLAADAGGQSFADLALDERIEIVRRIAATPDPLMQGMVRLFFTLSAASLYGDATTSDPASGPPLGWNAVGYPGPATGYELARPAPAADQYGEESDA